MKEKIRTNLAQLESLLPSNPAKIAEIYENISMDFSASTISVSTAAAIIDHTQLSFSASKKEIETLCEQAAEYHFKAICVNPLWIKHAFEIRNSLNADFLIASVIDFPLGASSLKSRITEASQALKDGADELDIVISIGMIKSKNNLKTYQLLSPVCQLGGYNKIILETSALDDGEKIDAALIAYLSGADMLKTSTGVNGKAAIEDVSLLRMIAGSKGVKAAGGIRDQKTLQEMVQAGADRIGCSSSVSIIKEWE